MVRLYIRNGICNMERFFKLVSTEGKVAVLFYAYRKESFTFQEIKDELDDSPDDSALVKRLTELVAANMLDKLVYNRPSGSRATYHVTQKALDIHPAFEMMHTFCSKWLHIESTEVSDWIIYVKKLLGSRWNARIVWLLFVLRSVRFNELKNSIEGISFKMLTQQLRYLEGEDVVLRTDFHENPPHIEYSLTAKGEALYNIILTISSWYAQYEKRGLRESGETQSELILSI